LNFADAKFGGGKGIRTPDLLIANETLYQLSYTPEIFGKSPLKVQNLACISTGGPPVLPPLMIFRGKVELLGHSESASQKTVLRP
jgi:hypothetical protein